MNGLPFEMNGLPFKMSSRSPMPLVLREKSQSRFRVPERDGVRYTCPGDDAVTEFQEEKADVVSVR